ncbi:hypothetical protein [Elizabethkingia occulta]|nr:hypothetical protein [Elizabethkingia occulta]
MAPQLSLKKEAMDKKGVIIHLDNDLKGILRPSKDLFDQSGIDVDYIICETKEEFNIVLSENKGNIKGLVFDLLSEEPTSGEINQNDATFLEDVKNGYAVFNIPIFVYSGYLQALTDTFDNCGTVFKVDKGSDNFKENVIDKFSLFYNSGFIDVFCPGGLLEKQIHVDLHNAFTKQFLRNDEIEKIINNIRGGQPAENVSDRIKKVFKRIAVRTLLFELLLPELNEDGQVIEETVSTTEHYIRRIGSIPVWTGDIFRKKDTEDFIFILTPRCNVIRNTSVLVCPFIWKEVISKKDKISKMLQGDPTVSGYDRHLPPSPIFEGGKLSLSKYFMIEKQDLKDNYERIITLSDELTNEILGKFGSHFFRTGITPWDPNEAGEEIAAGNA